MIGHRCGGFSGAAYWNCLLSPLVFQGHQFTATSYPLTPAPRRTVALGPRDRHRPVPGPPGHGARTPGRADRRLAVGISGQPSTAFLSPRVCPYSGFSNNPQYDNLLRCLRSPVWYTFDPPATRWA